MALQSLAQSLILNVVHQQKQGIAGSGVHYVAIVRPVHGLPWHCRDSKALGRMTSFGHEQHSVCPAPAVSKPSLWPVQPVIKVIDEEWRSDDTICSQRFGLTPSPCLWLRSVQCANNIMTTSGWHGMSVLDNRTGVYGLNSPRQGDIRCRQWVGVSCQALCASTRTRPRQLNPTHPLKCARWRRQHAACSGLYFYFYCQAKNVRR